jgi:hypothetical protein
MHPWRVGIADSVLLDGAAGYGPIVRVDGHVKELLSLAHK